MAAAKSKAKAAVQEEEATPVTGEIVTVEQVTALAAFGDAKKLAKMKTDIARALKEVVPVNLDMGNRQDRQKLKSIAAKIPKLKTKMDAWGAESVEEMRAQISSIDAARKELRDFLDEKRVEIRKPLTDWEEAEEKRQTEISNEMERIKGLAKIPFGASAADIAAKLEQLPKFDAAFFAEYAEEAELIHANTFDTLVQAKTIAENAEREAAKRAEEAAELEELRKANAESARIQNIRNTILRIKALGAGTDLTAPSDAELTTKDLIRTLNSIRITPDFLEFFEEASDAKDAAMEKLNQRVAAEAAERAKKEAEEAAERDRQAEVDRAKAEAEEERQRAAALEKQLEDRKVADQVAAEQQAQEAEVVQRHQEVQRTAQVMHQNTADERRDRAMAEAAEDIEALLQGLKRHEAPLHLVAGAIAGKIRHIRFEVL